MIPLDTDRLFLTCPYAVIRDGDEYTFKSEHDIIYAVAFTPDESFSPVAAYWFDLTNRSRLPSPNDPKVRETIIRIIAEFFRQNPDILLYMCDNANDQQAMRSRLFLRWFNGYEQQKLYDIRTAVLAEDGIDSYVALIIQRSHPQYEDIIKSFDSEITMFKDHKPQ